ncbi:MAG TPA: MarR family transcriptional regulator [Anaerolineaceae bacterium]|nr:MarR family transcriptional regulator [Anaerolineaceae bacterium]
MFPCICRIHKKNVDLQLGQSALFHGQARLLMILANENGLTHSEVAGELRISPAAATKVIKRMEQDGYVSREADSADERISRVFLQPKGRTVVNEIHETFQNIDRVMFAGFSDQDLQLLRDFLGRVLENLQNNLTKAS